jgi:hypothetical protein
MLVTQLTGKTTEKRQNLDFSTPPTHTQHLYSTLNGETTLSAEEEGRGNPSQSCK